MLLTGVMFVLFVLRKIDNFVLLNIARIILAQNGHAEAKSSRFPRLINLFSLSLFFSMRSFICSYAV